ncbi:MAG: hypothetical protein SGI97_02775 [candidate division Zixibacteria bacterium]|nr:hypothetical protein [candidate division Zixibacteria bacterium]
MLEYLAYGLNILVGLSLIYVFFRTVKGRPIGRRIVFLYIAIAVISPLFMNLVAPLPDTDEVQKLYRSIQTLSPGSKVLCSFDYDPQSAPELQPMAVAFLKYAFKHDFKIIIMGLWPAGPQQANQAIAVALADTEIAAKNLQYGTDYVNLGFQSGNEFVIQSMGNNFKQMFPSDDRRTPYDQIPILQNVVNFSNIDFVMDFSSGKPGSKEWVQIAVDRFGAKVGAGNTAVQAPEMYPYLRAGQLQGLMGGMTGAAEFEKTLKEPGKASTFLLSQMFGHATVIMLIIIGNVAYFTTRRKSV